VARDARRVRGLKPPLTLGAEASVLDTVRCRRCTGEEPCRLLLLPLSQPLLSAFVVESLLPRVLMAREEKTLPSTSSSS